MYTFTCFGEVLWDVFPNHKKIGGAPLNVALRLKSFVDKVAIISAVGADKLGEELMKYLSESNLNINYIQVKETYETGHVKVTIGNEGSASYDIKNPASWDFIELNSEAIELVSNSSVFVFGSLVCRNSVSRNTLFQLIEYANFKVFDVNLRAPYYSFELLSDLMQKADFIKFNDEEIALFSSHLNSGFTSLEDNMKFISNKFDASHICVTKGKDGAVLLLDGNFYNNKGYKIKVKDTVGAGDSFLATLIYHLTTGAAPEKALDVACAVGAMVAASEGANPTISEASINLMLR